MCCFLSKIKSGIEKIKFDSIIQIFGLLLFIFSMGSQVAGKDFFTEPYTVTFAITGIALFILPRLDKFNLPGGFSIELRAGIKQVQETQLAGEVIFNKDDESQNLYWVDPSNSKKRFIQDKDTASLFKSSKGFIGINKDIFNKLESGINIESLKKESFKCSNKRDFFAVHDGKVFYLSSMSLPIKYGCPDAETAPEMKEEDFKNEIFR